MEDMFAKDPAFVYRDSKGRYATPEKARTDKAIEENKTLRLNVEKYKRMYLATADMSSRYHRELVALKEQLKKLMEKGVQV